MGSGASAALEDALVKEGTPESALASLFAAYDKNEDGVLGDTEVEQLFTHLSEVIADRLSGNGGRDDAAALAETVQCWRLRFTDNGVFRYSEFRDFVFDVKRNVLRDVEREKGFGLPAAMSNLYNVVLFAVVKRMLNEAVALDATQMPLPSPPNPNMPTRELWWGLRYPYHDEDLPDKTMGFFKRLKFSLASTFIPHPSKNDTWSSRENAIEMTTATFEEYMGKISNHDNEKRDWVSDAGTGLYAFQSQGCVNLRRLDAADTDPDGAQFVYRGKFMHDYQVAEGFVRLGCDAFFSSGRLPVRIEYPDGRIVRPSDDADAWELAKYMFRTTMFHHNNSFNHFARCHFLASTANIIAVRKHLQADHVLRRLFHPFQYGGISVGDLAAETLVKKGGIQHRWGFDWDDGYLRLLGDSINAAHFIYKPFPDEMEERGLLGLAEGMYPFAEDGLLVWNIFERFVGRYFQMYGLFSDGDSSAREPVSGGGGPSSANSATIKEIDPETHRMWAELREQFPEGSLADLTRWGQVRKYATWFIFHVTCYHEHVGNPGDQWHDPYIAGAPPRQGATPALQLPYAGPELHAMACITKIGVGMKMPGILEDFTHVMKDEDAKAAVRTMQKELREAIGTIEERNKKREFAFNGCNPKFMEVSCSI